MSSLKIDQFVEVVGTVQHDLSIKALPMAQFGVTIFDDTKADTPAFRMLTFL